MSLGNRGLPDPIVGVNQFMYGRKVSQELSPGSGMKATFKIGSGKDDDLEEDMNNPLYYNKMGLPSRPSDRDLQQQMSQMNLYGGSQQSVDFKRDETWKLSSQLGTSLADPTADLWRSSSSSQMSKANLSGSYNLMGVPQSSGRSMGSSSQFSRSLSQPTADRFNPLSGSISMQTTVSTGFQQSPSSSPTSGQTSPGSRGLLSMGQRGIIGQGLLNSSSSGHQQAGSQGLLSGGLSKQNRPSQYQSGMGSPSRNSPTFLSLGMSQLQQQQQQLPSHSQQPPQRMGSFGSLNSLTSSSGSGPRMMPNVSSQGNFLSPSLQSGSLLSGGHDFQNLAAGSSFDLDFPALANRQSAVASSSSAGSQPLPIRTGYGQVVMVAGKAQVEGNQEFQIHSEDFPALPGSQSSDPSADLKTSGGGTSYEQVLKDGSSFPILSSVDARLPRALGDKKSRLPGSMGIQTSSSGVITNIPAGMVTDQFGMIGLLTFIRAAETEPNLVTLALGSDLTTLGLNLNSTESLYHTFGSPFSDTTCRPHEIDFHVPQEYMINQFIRDKLAPIKLARYGEDLLFYLYYTNCGDILQLAAAAELYQRDYRYHKEERVWITRAPGMEPQEKTGTYERGTYYYFDPQTWRKVPKEFCVEYDKLEERPTAQQAVAQHQQQQ